MHQTQHVAIGQLRHPGDPGDAAAMTVRVELVALCFRLFGLGLHCVNTRSFVRSW
eukprot:m.124750 g.124750  ORF g.124750 m.124750 type:complete len:55 (+) comp16631_c0_seq3:121-285(+)